MTSKRRLAQLKNARLASVAHFQKRKLERIFNTEQPRIDDNELNANDTGDTGNTGDTGDTGADTDEEGTCFWNQSANELELTQNEMGILIQKEIQNLKSKEKGLELKREPPPKIDQKK